MSERARKWAVWVPMILGALLFAVADFFASRMDRPGENVSASAWIRWGVRHSHYLVAIVGVALVIWHFVVQAIVPGLPL